jgi:hypothetical protein
LNLRPSGYEPDERPGCSTPGQWVRLLSEPAFGHDVPGPVLCQLRRHTLSASVLDTTQLLDRGPFPTMLCRNRQVSGLLEQLPKLRLGSDAHGSICVQEGEPNLRKGRCQVLAPPRSVRNRKLRSRRFSGFLSFEALKRPHALRASSRCRTPNPA